LMVLQDREPLIFFLLPTEKLGFLTICKHSIRMESCENFSLNTWSHNLWLLHW
jgi:hypothetical protein